jgi:glycosyltransferase involved in cell wall biosynthesis
VSETEFPGKRVTVVGHFGWGVYRYRLDLLRALVREGWHVVAIADWSDGAYEPLVKAEGIRTEGITLTRRRFDPFSDLRTLVQLALIYRRIKPDVAQHFNARTFLLGAIAARLCRVPTIVNGVNGIGIILGGTLSAWRRAIIPLYRVAFGGRVVAVFQNQDDRERMIALRIIPRQRTFCVPGSGVDTDALRPDPAMPAERRNIVIMASRILRSKGVMDFANAVERLKPLFPHIRFVLAGARSGSYGMHDPDDVDDATLRSFVTRGLLEWPGHVEPADLEHLYRRAAVVVLPSFYPEGVPRCLIEGAAAGAPLVTTDTPGCRDIVIDGISGHLVAPHSPEQLADAIGAILSTPGAIARMGAHSRRLAVEVFDMGKVNAAFLKIYEGRHTLIARTPSVTSRLRPRKS